MMRERVAPRHQLAWPCWGSGDPCKPRVHPALDHPRFSWRQGGRRSRCADSTGADPPVTKIGVLDLDSFYPAKERFALVMALMLGFGL